MGNEESKTRGSSGDLNKQIAVLKANSDLSEQEIRDLYDEFKRESPSGKMDKNQFLKFYKKVAGSDDNSGVLSDNVFTVFDNNKDGSIDFSEFVLAASMGNKKDLDSQLDLAFGMIDVSGDGRVTYNEMVKFMGKVIKLTNSSVPRGVDAETAATAVFDMFKLDQSEKLNQSQFINGCKNNTFLKEIFASS